MLCHMNPSLHDPQYQGVADRGAFIEYDMVRMDFYATSRPVPV